MSWMATFIILNALFFYFLCEHLELQEPFTGFVKPASVLKNKALLWVIFKTCSKKWTRKFPFPPLSTSRLQPCQANVGALHHNKQFRTDQLELHMYDFCLFLWLRTSELSIMLSLSSIWTHNFSCIAERWSFSRVWQAVIDNPGIKI